MAEHEIIDLLVVGAGPAGAATAIAARRRGLSVAVLDKARFPRDKICGDGLTTGALRILEDLGVETDAISSWTRVDDIFVSGPNGHTVCFPLPRDRGSFAVVARRFELDAAVLDRARKVGADVREGIEVTGIEHHDDHVVLKDAQEGVHRARFVVAADGMWSPLRKLLGASIPGYRGEWHAFRQYFTNVGPQASQLWVWFEEDLLPGYAWSFPLPDGGANVGFGIQRGAKVTTKEMKALWPDLLARPNIAAVLGPDATPTDRHYAWPIPARIDDITLTSGRVLWVGDAAAATDPMTGEGIGQALLSGVLAAEAVAEGGTASAVRGRYELAIKHELVADHQMSMLLIRALRHRKGARAAIRVAGANAWTRRNFARWLFEDEPRAAAFTPRRWHRDFLRRDGAYRNR